MKIAIYDNDEYYINKVKNIMNEIYKDEIFITLIKKDVIQGEVNGNNYDIIVLPEEYKTMYEGRDRKILYFSKDQSVSEINKLYKFSDAETMYNKMLKFYENMESLEKILTHNVVEEVKQEKISEVKNEKVTDNASKVNVNAHIISFVSLGGGMGNSTVAAGAASYFSHIGKRVVYINLKPFGGNGVFEINESLSIKDFIDSGSIREAISRLGRDESGVSIISNTYNMEELGEISVNDWNNLILYLSEVGQYEVIVFDMSMIETDKLWNILINSNRIGCVLNESNSGRSKLDGFLQYLNNKAPEYIDRVSVIFNKFKSMPKIDEKIEKNVIGGVGYVETENTRDVINKLKNMKFLEALL